MIKIIILLLLVTMLAMPHKERIHQKIVQTLSPKKESGSLMNRETTGIDRRFFNINDDLPYLSDYNSEPLPYKRYEINPLPKGKIIDDRDKNLRQLKNEACFGE